ncbi:amphi-Trp domain-containing protein [candidate division WOR-3 bacterium]|nr:amphi-Trp domain-containing protein [candidate division WOR-3 bacterium]
MSKKEIKIKTSGTVAEISAHLENLAKSMLSGRVSFEKGDESIILSPEGELYMEIEAVYKKSKEKVEIEIEWKKTSNDDEDEDTEFSINSVE